MKDRRRTRGWLRLALLPLALLADACASVRPPQFSAENAWGRAYAASQPAAERLSTHIESLAPLILAYVPGLSPVAIDARFVDELHFVPNFAVSPKGVFQVDGITIQKPCGRWIEQMERASPLEEQRILAHEIVHYWIGPDWDPLPEFLEEGLADNVRDHVVPRGYAKESLERVLLLASVLGTGFVYDEHGRALGFGFEATAANPGSGMTMLLFNTASFPTALETLAVGKLPFPAARVPAHYAAMDAFGYVLVARIGVPRLHALCLRARAEGRKLIPGEWVLEAAGLPSDQKSPEWRRAILELYGPVEAREILRRNWESGRKKPDAVLSRPG